jgi:hypothetical protein
MAVGRIMMSSSRSMMRCVGAGFTMHTPLQDDEQASGSMHPTTPVAQRQACDVRTACITTRSRSGTQHMTKQHDWFKSTSLDDSISTSCGSQTAPVGLHQGDRRRVWEVEGGLTEGAASQLWAPLQVALPHEGWTGTL